MITFLPTSLSQIYIILHYNRICMLHFQLNTFVRHLDSINKIQNDITRYEHSGGKNKLESVQKTLTKMQKDRDELISKRQELQEQIDSMKTELSNQEVITKSAIILIRY